VIEDYQAKRKRGRLVARALMGGGLFLAAASALLTFVYVSQLRDTSTAGPTIAMGEVLVAGRDLPSRTLIAAGDVVVVRTASELIPAPALRSAESAIGSLTSVPIYAGEVMLASKFAAVDAAGFSIFPAGQQPTASSPDYRAMSLKIADANAVGGVVQAGDVVDVIFAFTYQPLTFGVDSAAEQDFAARILAERTVVLARAADIYTLRVEAAQAERLAALQAGGTTMHLLLRAGDDRREPRAAGAVFSSAAGEVIRAIPTIPPLRSPTPAPR
jgi:Flp pilus assembly protein CpaB